MKRTFAICTILCSFGLLVSAQNLVQNPSFENRPDYDEFWLLSLTDPSSASAVATRVTTDAHEGSTSVELSNTVNTKWTYFYTDSINAPLSFQANKSYEVMGWMRSVEEAKNTDVSVFWNGSQSFLSIYAGNPDPVSNPDWFMVKDTITPTADFSDGYLRLGLRATKHLDNTGAGRLLFDDFSVIRIPDNTETEILAMSFPGQLSPAVIDPLLGTFQVEVHWVIDLGALAPDNIVLSRGATISPAVGQPQDFSSPVVYTVTAQDESTTRDWTVTVVHGLNTETSITSFSLAEATGPALINDLDSTITIEVEFGTNLTSLVPTIAVSYGATITPNSGVAYDFSGPAYYLVIAEDGTTDRLWTVQVTVRPPSSATAITAFSVPELIAPATINGGVQFIMGRVPYGTDLTTLVPSIDISPGATIDPLPGLPTDFTNPVNYEVVAEDGATTQNWVAAILMEPNTETDITSFVIPELLAPATINSALHTVTGTVPFGTDLTALVPGIGLSGGASINPPSDVPTDFSSTVTYTITADDGITTQDWIVNITEGTPSTETDITAFTLPELAVPATIDDALHTVVGEVPYGTDLTSLVPTIEVSTGATIDPLPGVSTNFSSPVSYTVTAQDGSTTQVWVVSIQVLPNTETDITSFHIPELAAPAIINDALHTVVGEVPYGTDLTALVPVIGLSEGATINPLSGVAMDFSSPATYTVTAEDGTTVQDWAVTITVLPNTETDITAFTLAEETGPATIDLLGHAVTIEVSYGTDLAFLTPNIAVSPGATIDPQSGTSQDFTSGLSYTVTAEDGVTLQVWNVTVTLSPANTETDIVAFSIPQLISPAVIDNSLHTVSGTVAYGTNLTARVPTIAVSPGATIDPGSGTVTDLSSPVTYTVTAEDGTTTQEWVVSIAALPNTETDITGFSLTEQTGASTISRTDHTIDIEVVSGTDITSLAPSITVSPGAVVDPADGVSQDFTDPVDYLVTAEDGITTQIWTVTVSVARTVGIGTGQAEAISIYPNPASDFLHIELTRETHVRLHDLMGKLCYSEDRVNGDLSLNVSEFKRGIYIVSLLWEDGSLQQRKIILQ